MVLLARGEKSVHLCVISELNCPTEKDRATALRKKFMGKVTSGEVKGYLVATGVERNGVNKFIYAE
jgi:hypothetical protein